MPTSTVLMVPSKSRNTDGVREIQVEPLAIGAKLAVIRRRAACE